MASTTPPTSYAHSYLTQHIVLTAQGKQYFVTRKELGCSFPDAINDKTITPDVKFNVDTDQLTHFLTTLAPRVNHGPRPAVVRLVHPFVHEVSVKSDNIARPAVAVPAEANTKLLIPESTDSIAKILQSFPLSQSIPLVIKAGAVAPGTDKLAGINARLSHFVTHFDTAEVGRTVTVRRAISLVDGTVLAPGQIFSINETVGVRTVARGFGIGKVFINGTMEDQVGGGMCQVATTLFNAALLANLEIVERHQHVRTVPYLPAEMRQFTTAKRISDSRTIPMPQFISTIKRMAASPYAIYTVKGSRR